MTRGSSLLGLFSGDGSEEALPDSPFEAAPGQTLALEDATATGASDWVVRLGP